MSEVKPVNLKYSCNGGFEHDFESNEQSEYCANGCGEKWSIYTIKALNAEIEKLKAEVDRLNSYVISGHQIIENEMKAEIEKLRAENANLKQACELNRQVADAINDNGQQVYQFQLLFTKLTRQRDLYFEALDEIKDKTESKAEFTRCALNLIASKALQEAVGME